MRAGALFELVARDLRRQARTFSVAALGITTGVAVLAFFLALTAGLREVVLGRIFPLDQVEVVPVESGVGSLLSMLNARPPGIEQDELAALRRIPGVREVTPRLRLSFPSSGRARGALQGRDIGIGELVGDGVDPALVLRDLPPGTDFTDPEGRSSHQACHQTSECPAGEQCLLPNFPPPNTPPPEGRCSAPIPVVVSPYLVEVFDGAIAPAHGLPRMGEIILRSVRGLVFEWDLGRAGMGNATRGTPRRVYARLVGVSPQAVDLGVTIPLEVARRLNREYAGDAAADRYSSAVLKLRSPADLTDVSGSIRGMSSLTIRTSGAEQMGLMVKLITVILAFASVVTVVVAALNIAHVFLSLIAERRGEIGLMRALGATQRDIRTIILAQALALGLLASAGGLALARVAAALCNHLARTRLPAFPFKPDEWFVFAPSMVGAVVAFGVGACVLSAIVPAVRASRVEPASALAGGV